MSEEAPPYYPFSLRPGADLGEQLATRGESSGAVAKRDLLRYYRLLERELARVDLTPADVDSVLAAVAHWGQHGEDPMQTPLWAIIDESGRGPAAATDLVRKMRALSPGATVAIIDAIERFRRAPAQSQTGPARTETLRAVGLLRPPETSPRRARQKRVHA